MLQIYIYTTFTIVLIYILINFTFTIKSLEAIHKKDEKRKKKLNQYEDMTQVFMDIISIIVLIICSIPLLTWTSGVIIITLGCMSITLSIAEYANQYRWHYHYKHMNLMIYKIASIILLGVVILSMVIQHS